MNVRFKGDTKIYDLIVTIPGQGLVCIQNPPLDVNPASGFEVLTPKGTVFGRYTEHTTVYRQLEDGSIILSADGSVWTPPPEPEPVPEPEPYVPSLEEVKEMKRAEMSTECEQTIYAGIDVELPGGWAHFSLKQNDQLNLFGKQAQLMNGAEKLEYHEDGQPCRYFTKEEMLLIIAEAMHWVSYHTTYCNSLFVWITNAETVEEMNAIFYGADIPEEYQSQVLKDYLAELAEEPAEVAADEAVS